VPLAGIRAAAFEALKWADPEVGHRHRIGGAPEHRDIEFSVLLAVPSGDDVLRPVRFDQ